MAKKKKEWPKSLKDLTGFVLVTEDNKKKALVTGRQCYVIENLQCLYPMEVRPRLTKGHWFVSQHPMHPDFDYWVINGEETVTEYREYMLRTIGKAVEEKKLFIKLNDKIAKFERG